MPNYRLKPITIEVYGLLSHSTFHQARCCAEDMHKSNPRGFAKPVIEGMFEFQWTQFVNEKKAELRGEMWGFNGEVLCFNGKKIYQSLDDLLEFANGTHEYEEYRADELYEAIAEEEYNNYFLSNYKNSYVQMKVAIDSEEAGNFLIELYDDKCGETCENFRMLCTGEYGDDLHYLDTCFHRIVPNGWLQGGDIVSGSGNGGRSIYGDDEGFADETFQIKHNTRGMVGMANHGRHSNNSQFYITFQPAPWMNCKYVAIGCIGWDSWKTIFISTIATIFALIGMIITQFAYHGQIQLQYDQLKTDYESNNTYYEAQLTHKVTGRQVVEGLESLRSSVRAQTRGLRNELNGIEVETSSNSSKIDEANCMLQTRETPETRYCCALLAQNMTKKNAKRYEHCLSLMLSLRYGIKADEESTVMHHEVRELDPSPFFVIKGGKRYLPNYCKIWNNRRLVLTVCCLDRENCPTWKYYPIRHMCNVCHRDNKCPVCRFDFNPY